MWESANIFTTNDASGSVHEIQKIMTLKLNMYYFETVQRINNRKLCLCQLII